MVVQQQRVIAEQVDRIAELARRLGQDSSTSSRPPSSDAPWDKQPARKRSSRSRSGRKPDKQPGSASASRSLARTRMRPLRCGTGSVCSVCGLVGRRCRDRASPSPSGGCRLSAATQGHRVPAGVAAV
ncbi:MAG: DUF6444 domain-containing protein [Pseudonocardiaceae bacterium]